ncbi:GDSL family lipase [Pedobacter yonginense]|uniref:GDSL family lipase n=1 Tax=Pedobacter yonginense TaxID=651869 RepID=A0A317EJ11_9SPHI|nr:GDSL-type esterase/lipase family protein [Pedobacter yonginense]PWS26315.1 GDSL family lipase [Pedobacter yonginense]
MMKILNLLVVLILGSVLFAHAQASIDSAFLTPNYKQRREIFNKTPTVGGEVVFIGNSITEVGNWQKLIPDERVLNRGISGDVTLGVLARVAEEVANKPKKVFVMIGINDLKIGVPIAQITARQREIIQLIRTKAPNTLLYMQATLPVNEKMLAKIYSRLNNKDILKMNKALKALCRELHVGYINLQPIFVDQDGQLKAEWSTDGLHLKPQAYEAWVKYLRKKGLI